LQVRRERFQEELESYQKQVEEFSTYGDLNEINKYLKKSQTLDTFYLKSGLIKGMAFGGSGLIREGTTVYLVSNI
jgi:hypothetical protein